MQGQLIYLQVKLPGTNITKGLQGTTHDDAATLARNFATKHNLGLLQQIKIKKLVQTKIETFSNYEIILQ